jgi:hypothetical protein
MVTIIITMATITVTYTPITPLPSSLPPPSLLVLARSFLTLAFVLRSNSKAVGAQPAALPCVLRAPALRQE